MSKTRRLLILLVFLTFFVAACSLPGLLNANSTTDPAGTITLTSPAGKDSGSLSTVTPLPDNTNVPVQASPQKFLFIGEKGNIYQWSSDAAQAEPLTSDANPESFTSRYSHLILSPDKKYLLSLFEDRFRLFDLTGGSMIMEDYFYPIGWMPDSRSFLVTPSGNPCTDDEFGVIKTELFQYSVDSSQPVFSIGTVELFSPEAKLSADGNWLVAPYTGCYSEIGSMQTFSFQDKVQYAPGRDFIQNPDFAHQSNRLIISSNNNNSGIVLISDPQFSQIENLSPEMPDSVLYGLKFSYDDQWVALNAADSFSESFFDPLSARVMLLNVAQKEIIDITEKGFIFLNWYPDSLRFLIAHIETGEVYSWSVENHMLEKLNFKLCTHTYCLQQALPY